MSRSKARGRCGHRTGESATVTNKTQVSSPTYPPSMDSISHRSNTPQPTSLRTTD